MPSELFEPNNSDDLSFGRYLRWIIFYSGESAYRFQYRDLSRNRYKKDNDWFLTHKGFSIQQAIDIVISIQSLQIDKINNLGITFTNQSIDKFTFLPAYIFTDQEISIASKIKIDIVKFFLESFDSSLNIDDFNSIDDFNPKNAYPIIKISEDKYLLFELDNLVEALYTTPFFWFIKDSKYKSIATKHRGEFTEEFSAERLKLVFGQNRVFLNVKIYDSKKELGEIDVLVVFANIAIILQAKAKTLTNRSRKGNDDILQEDFRLAIQQAYDQAYSCAMWLQNRDYKLIDQNNNELSLNREFKEIYPFCVISDHYPSLTSQVKLFLKFREETENIKAPFVMDIFLLDVMTEMLQSPLHFLRYLKMRTDDCEDFFSPREITMLAYYLKYSSLMNIPNCVMIPEENICVPDLDIAMATRRDSCPGSDTPQGILTQFKGTILEQIIKDLEELENPTAIDLGFMLLSLKKNEIDQINESMIDLIDLGKKDGQPHDLTFSMSRLTIHFKNESEAISRRDLERHCEERKYIHKANLWFGICIGQEDTRLRFVVKK